jgi:hypothetical protein
MNKTPLFICLCGVFNHQNHWVENIMQCFLSQDYEGRAELYLIDDRPGYASEQQKLLQGSTLDRGMYHVTVPNRFDRLMAKYDFGIAQADVEDRPWDKSYVCVLDDDDIYLPHFLSDHAKVLETEPWSYPSRVFSAYGGTFQSEPSGARFWASSAYRLESLRAIGGYGTSCVPAFDQIFLSRMRQQFGESPKGPDREGYIYNWSGSYDNHTSFYMGAQDNSWYTQTPPSALPEGPLVPRYNDKHEQVMQMYKVFTGQSQ